MSNSKVMIGLTVNILNIEVFPALVCPVINNLKIYSLNQSFFRVKNTKFFINRTCHVAVYTFYSIIVFPNLKF